MFGFLSDISNYINDFIAEFTGLVSLLLIVILFFVFDFKFLVRATRMLRKQFKSLNLGFFVALSTAWRLKTMNVEDKTARYKYLKAFCEYAIFSSKGQKLSQHEWNSITSKYFYEQVLADPFKISLDSSFDIINDDVDEYIKKYFAFLNKNHKKYLHNRAESKFVCKLAFENGFVYPASFINGLERKFSDSWTDLLVKYNYTLKNDKYHNTKNSGSIIKSMALDDNQNFIMSHNDNSFNLRSNELFMMYSWLMWSPSYQMTFPDDKYKIILYGIGDESNTTNLILDTSKNSLELWDKLKECMAKKVYGVGLSIECELYELVPYMRHNMEHFNIETKPLINNLLNNSNDVHFILSYVSPTENAFLHKSTLVEDNDAFFSGYLWALFGRQDEKHTRFDIKNSVVFFEHTNLADSTSVDYFTKALAQKTVLHFKEVLKDENPNKYTLNFYVSEAFKERYIEEIEQILSKEDEEFTYTFYKYVSLTDNQTTVNEILENIDEEFPINDIEFNLVTTASEIGEFYTKLYVDNFAPDERDSIDDLIHRTLELKSENHHDIILAYSNGVLAGGIVFDWFKDSNCGLLEYIVVGNKFRGMRVAQRLVAKAIAQLTHYAGKKPLNGVFIEVEDPEKMEGLEEQAAVDNYRRLQLWSNNRFARVDMNYIQPALDDGLNKLENLMLAVNTLKTDSEYLDAKIVKSFLIDFNKICNRIENIDDPDLGVKEMLDELDAKPDGKVKILYDSIKYIPYKPKSLKDEA